MVLILKSKQNNWRRRTKINSKDDNKSVEDKGIWETDITLRRFGFTKIINVNKDGDFYVDYGDLNLSTKSAVKFNNLCTCSNI